MNAYVKGMTTKEASRIRSLGSKWAILEDYVVSWAEEEKTITSILICTQTRNRSNRD